MTELQWKCNKCDEALIETSIPASYLGITRSVFVLQCPQCKTAYTEKYIAKSLIAAEELFEKKRA